MTSTTDRLEVATRPNSAAAPKLPVSLQGPIKDLDEAWRLAQILAQSDLVPQDLRNKPANVFLIVLYGQQLNLPAVIAIQTISVIKGRPVMSGKLLLAKVREAGHRPSIRDHTATSCTVHIRRGDTGEEHSETFTLAEAIDAKLVQLKDGKPYARSKQGEPLPWETWTKRMLLWRTAGFAVDAICPEIRMGFAIEGEVDDDRSSSRPTLAQVAAERTDKPKPTPTTSAAEVAAQVAQIAAEHAATTGSPEAGADEPQDAETDDQPDKGRLTPIHSILTNAGITDREHKLRVLRAFTGRADITSSNDLTADEARSVRDILRRTVNDTPDGTAVIDAIDWLAAEHEERHGWSTP